MCNIIERLDHVLLAAAAAHAARKARRDHPVGSFDRKQRWHPAESERQVCCASIRPPTATYPHTLNQHCRSVTHVAELYGVDSTRMRGLLRTTVGRGLLSQPDNAMLVLRLELLSEAWGSIGEATRGLTYAQVLQGLARVGDAELVEALTDRLIAATRPFTPTEVLALLQSPQQAVRMAVIQRIHSLMPEDLVQWTVP